MTSRRKSLLTYFLVLLASLLFLTAVNHWYTTRTVDSTVDNLVQNNLNSIVGEVDHRLQESEKDLTSLAVSSSLQEYMARKRDSAVQEFNLTRNTSGSPASDIDAVPDDVRFSLQSTLGNNLGWRRLTLYARNRLLPLLQVEKANDAESAPSRFRLGNFSPAEFDKDVLFSGKSSLRLVRSNLQCTAPVFDKAAQSVMGLIVGEANFSDIVANVASSIESVGDNPTNVKTLVVAVDRVGTILYHSNHVLYGQRVKDATPELTPLVSAATSNQGGTKTFKSPSGQYFTTAFASLPKLGVAISVAQSKMSRSSWWLLVTVGFSILTALAGALLIERYVQKKMQGMARVTEDLRAIAKGELNRRIELKSSDDARGLADNINVVTERLRAQIAREAESRQFESFVRLSAMLTHDLKNAIEALSLTVGNMERHFDNEQFRADAMKSVAGATDKLKVVVARLTRPLTSLSGEHKRPVNVDLVPMLKRTVTATVGPLAQKHDIKLELPDSLEALANAERIGGVIENLVINALEAMGEQHGTLTIRGSKLDNNWVVFSVSDSGPGMSRSFIEHKLFRPFSTTKRKGIGLGLYTCRETVQADGGSIEVESKEGAGTTFRVVLPSASSEVRDQTGGAATSLDANR